jgi:hypothetical protein
MPFAEEFMLQGTFAVPASLTSPAVQLVNCGFLPTKVQLINRSAIASMTGGPPKLNPGTNYLGFQWDWNVDFGSTVTSVLAMAPNNAVANVPVVSNGVIVANGIAQYNGQVPSPGVASVGFGPTVTGGALSKANPAQLTSTAHGLQTGDQIVITGPFTAATAMNQLGGVRFTVTVTGANTVTIPIDTSGANFTATTVTTWRKVIQPAYYYPQHTVITGITAANPMVITTATNHGLTVGQQIRLNVPAVMGMTQANNIQAVITAVTATTITLGSVDSSAFSAFAWPATTSVPFNVARVIPIGSGPTPTTFLPNTQYNYDALDDATNNQSFQGFSVGTNILVQASTTVLGVNVNDVISWTAWRASI